MTHSLEGSSRVVAWRVSPTDAFPVATDVSQIPSTTRAVLFRYEPGLDRAEIDRLRAAAPSAGLVAWLGASDAAKIDEILRAGFDEVAFQGDHLHRVVERCAAERALAEQIRAEREVHAGLVDLIDEINAKPELVDVLRTAVLKLSTLFRIDRVSVVLFKAGEDVAFVVAEQEESLLDNLVIKISDYPELEAVISSGNPLVIQDVSEDSLLAGVRDRLHSARDPHGGAVLFPLMHQRDVVGALFLRSRGPIHKVEDRLLKMGRLIAAVTSVAIGRALEHDSMRSEQRALRRKKAEADRQVEGLRKFSDFFAQARDGILVISDVGAIQYANAAAGSILRVFPEDLAGQTFVNLLGMHSRQLAERALLGERVGGTQGYIDLLVPLNAGEEIVISAAMRTLGDGQGVLISFRDVTEIRAIETELRQTKEFLENLIQSSVDAIVAADVTGRIILFNRAAEEILGYRARDVVGEMNVADMYPPGEAKDVMRRLRSEAFGGVGRLETTRKELLARSGHPVPVSLTASMIYEGDQEIASVGVFTDLRERLKMEEKLSRVQGKLQQTERQAVAVELAGAAAHELNQPLTSILGYAELLRRRVPQDDPNRKPVDVICRETERMAKIVKKVGQITSYETKTYVGSSKILDLGAMEDDEEAGGR